MKYSYDKRIVLTLDAGGTNFVFSAIRSNEEIVEPVRFPSSADDLDKCLDTLEKGFRAVMAQLKEKPVAISFAFPGPADYVNGIIGDLPNLPAFRGGVALGPYLHEVFGLPVFINNDGDLFAYGESMSGTLPWINAMLESEENPKRYHNLIGLTFGTGFGCGVCINGYLNRGDNGSGGDIWVFRNHKLPEYIVEESVSIRAVKRVYAERSGILNPELTPKDIFEIAQGAQEGNQEAAQEAFAEMGRVAGEAIADAITLVDGMVVIGGGLSGAQAYFMSALVAQLNGSIKLINGGTVPRIQSHAYNLEDEFQLNEFLKSSVHEVKIPRTNKSISYNTEKRVGIAISKLGTSQAISLGAYAYALSELDKIEQALNSTY
ncbi:MAG: ROK family protein [Tannerellaceae bacterium]